MKTYEAIVKGDNVPEPGVPESFKVLIKELQSLGMDVKILSGDEEEIEMRDLEDDEETKKADGLALSNDEDAADLAPVDLERDAVTKE
ncbi:hypothetical protein BsIDN1_02110 [Bacillus safensis]|uniref:RNA polymerase Rpb2 domain-containing protein n=1 Tax=Bacillus safensis TaxID=561879 RepID=A0A5S9M0D7_BACIA|nr:hypothetical protein BsIDN1_02110 [Bacillus safensis]